MWFEDHLKRSMDRLTPDAREKLLTADLSARQVLRAPVATCPCCRTPVAIEVTATLLPVPAPSTAADPDDIPSPDPAATTADDTQLELAAVTPTNLVPA